MMKLARSLLTCAMAPARMEVFMMPLLYLLLL
jgi:hypothetical protein